MIDFKILQLFLRIKIPSWLFMPIPPKIGV